MRVGGRGGTQLIDTRTQLLLLVLRFSASAPLRGLLLAAWWARPSSPRPDLRRLRRAPGHGRFGFEVCWVVVSVLFVVCVCLCVVVCLCVFVCVCVCVFVFLDVSLVVCV